MDTRRLFFILSLLTLISIASATSTGSYTAITDLNDPHIVEIAKFAISEHNKKEKAQLEFVKVVKGASQVVSGNNYALEISAKNGAHVNNYEALVYEQPWKHYMSLTSFKALLN